MINIEVYSKDWCGYCDAAKALLTTRGLAYTEIDVTNDTEREAEMRTRSGSRAVPQIFVDGVHVVLGDDSGVTGARLREATTGKTRDLTAKGVFIAIGHAPNSALFAGQLALQDGYLLGHARRDGNVTATSVPGVFAAGDVADPVYRRAVTSAASGAMAALDADRYLSEQLLSKAA